MENEELKELSMSNLDKLLRALDEENIAEAKRCARTMEELGLKKDGKHGCYE